MSVFLNFQVSSFMSAILLLLLVYALTVAVDIAPREALYNERYVTERLEKRGVVVSVTWTLMVLAAACGEAMSSIEEYFISIEHETPTLAALIVCLTYAFVFFVACEFVVLVTVFLRVRILAVKALNEGKTSH